MSAVSLGLPSKRSLKTLKTLLKLLVVLGLPPPRSGIHAWLTIPAPSIIELQGVVFHDGANDGPAAVGILRQLIC